MNDLIEILLELLESDDAPGRSADLGDAERLELAQYLAEGLWAEGWRPS